MGAGAQAQAHGAIAAAPAAAPPPPPAQPPPAEHQKQQQSRGLHEDQDPAGKELGQQKEQCGGQEGQEGDDQLTSVSIEMAQLLRHDPPEGMDGCGFVRVSKLVEKLEQPTFPEEIHTIVQQDEKGRYQLADQGEGELRVRAVQGHSVPLKNPLHDPITAPEQVPLALHATSPESWHKIQASGELRRQGRTHIHFASEPRHLRSDDWASVLLQADLGRAIQAGIPFCRAANGVVLSEGPIPLEFVRRIKLRDLPEGWQAEIPNRERLLEEEQ